MYLCKTEAAPTCGSAAASSAGSAQPVAQARLAASSAVVIEHEAALCDGRNQRKLNGLKESFAISREKVAELMDFLASPTEEFVGFCPAPSLSRTLGLLCE